MNKNDLIGVVADGAGITKAQAGGHNSKLMELYWRWYPHAGGRRRSPRGCRRGRASAPPGAAHPPERRNASPATTPFQRRAAARSKPGSGWAARSFPPFPLAPLPVVSGSARRRIRRRKEPASQDAISMLIIKGRRSYWRTLVSRRYSAGMLSAARSSSPRWHCRYGPSVTGGAMRRSCPRRSGAGARRSRGLTAMSSGAGRHSFDWG